MVVVVVGYVSVTNLSYIFELNCSLLFLLLLWFRFESFTSKMHIFWLSLLVFVEVYCKCIYTKENANASIYPISSLFSLTTFLLFLKFSSLHSWSAYYYMLWNVLSNLTDDLLA